jgi:DNA-binding CsgD family transcriptional regulator
MMADVRTRDAAWVLAQCIEEGDCLLWQGRMGTGNNRANPLVSGILASGRSGPLPVRRMVWEHRNGPLKPGQVVYRTCCQNRCLACLEAGPPGSPMRQRKREGLTGHSPATKAALTRARRGRAGNVHTPEQVQEVKRLGVLGGTDAEIARQTGVSEAMVGKIRTGKCWADSVQGSSVFSLAGR